MKTFAIPKQGATKEVRIESPLVSGSYIIPQNHGLESEIRYCITLSKKTQKIINGKMGKFRSAEMPI
jgi:hypothetical protein